MQKISLTIRVDAGDLEAWRAEAGKAGMSLSAWMRERCNGGADKNVSGNRDVRVARRRADKAAGIPRVVEEVVERVAKKVKTCVHGKERGWNCWQCGGVARVE